MAQVDNSFVVCSSLKGIETSSSRIRFGFSSVRNGSSRGKAVRGADDFGVGSGQKGIETDQHKLTQIISILLPKIYLEYCKSTGPHTMVNIRRKISF